MKFVKPIAIGANLVSTTATETTAAYSAGATYAAGERVHVAADKRVYESLQPANTGNTPATSPLWWLDAGPMNAWAMFDAEVSTQTTATGSLTMVVDTGYANSIVVSNMVGAQLQISATDGPGGPSIYSSTINLDGTIISDWYQYFFEPSVQLGEVVRLDLPPYGAARLTLTITGTGAVAVGQVSIGTAYDLGGTKYGASVGIIDYSRKATDEFGKTTFVRRRFSRRMRATMDLTTAQINKVHRLLSDVRATPVAWIGADGETFAPLVVFGFYRDFSIEVPDPTMSLCSLEIEGLA